MIKSNREFSKAYKVSCITHVHLKTQNISMSEWHMIASVSRQLGAQKDHNPEASQGWQLPGWEQGPAPGWAGYFQTQHEKKYFHSLKNKEGIKWNQVP